MSSIYIQEPPTSGKVLLKTSVGDIDIELWAKECPKACRNFIQLCMEGYYNETIFHRVVKGFIVQGGDPDGNGTGGESTYGETFKDEFHSRLRFSRRGLLAMANSGPNDNGSQFFFTLGATPELQNKHTLFGKVTGDTIYNMIKLEDGEIEGDERPKYPHKIIRAEILNNPFDDIEPRLVVPKKEKSDKKLKKREKGVKNFGLLSFGDEAEEDEVETNHFVKLNSGKSKSTHDVLDDPKLSKIPIEMKEGTSGKADSSEDNSSGDEKSDVEGKKASASEIRNKLKANRLQPKKSTVATDSEDEDNWGLHKERNIEKKKQTDKIREEIMEVKKQYQQDKKRKNELLEKDQAEVAEKKQKSDLMNEYLNEKDKYNHLKKELPKKGGSREQFTLDLLRKFKSKLNDAKEKVSSSSENQKEDGVRTEPAQDEDVDWLGHELHFEEQAPVLAKDAVTKKDDWYDVFDPRNPINKRRRGADDEKRRSHTSRK